MSIISHLYNKIFLDGFPVSRGCKNKEKISVKTRDCENRMDGGVFLRVCYCRKRLCNIGKLPNTLLHFINLAKWWLQKKTTFRERYFENWFAFYQGYDPLLEKTQGVRYQYKPGVSGTDSSSITSKLFLLIILNSANFIWLW